MTSSRDLRQYAGISENGSILMGKNSVVDGYHHGRTAGILTHIHSDHSQYFTNMLHECDEVFMSRPTLDMLAVLDIDPNIRIAPDTYFKSRHIHGLDFGESIIPSKYMREPNPKKHYSDKITLYQSHHILGASQVLVVTEDGVRIVYSGDFVYPHAEPIECDAMILDATHGNPMFNAPVDPNSLERRLIECVENEIRDANPVCIRAHIGRLQYIMSILSREMAPNISFLASHKNQKLCPVYAKYGMPVREVIDYTTDRAERIMDGGFPFIEFKTPPERKSHLETTKQSAMFYLGGANMGPKTTIRQDMSKPPRYSIELGDHGTYDNILEYVKRCSPSLVITDSSRSKWGVPLAERITAELGIDAVSQPGGPTS